MPDGLVRLLWEVDSSGYDITRRRDIRDPAAEKYFTWAKTPDNAQFIVPRGGRPKRYEAGLREDSIFLDLANSARLPGQDGVKEFVNKWGQLHPPLGYASLARFIRYRDVFVRAIGPPDGDVTQLLREVSKSLGSDSPYEVGSLRVRYFTKGSQLYLQSRTLVQFCALELLQARAGKIDVTTCGACGRLLPIYRMGRTKLYCNDACKMVAYRANHGDQLNRARRQKRAKRR